LQKKEERKKEEVTSPKEKKTTTTTTNTKTEAPKGKAPPPLPKKKDNRPKLVALYDYNAQGQDEISFKEGDTLFLIEKTETGWWEGEINGKKGLFPGNYVEETK